MATDLTRMGIRDDSPPVPFNGLPSSSTSSLTEEENACYCSPGAEALSKEPAHSILKSPHPRSAHCSRSISHASGSSPVTISEKQSRKDSGQASPLYLGSSPLAGSFHDLMHLWADDLDEAGKSEFPLVVPPNRRSRSLKATKTPPGTLNPKKMVRFADALGLDLEKVRHFLQDQIPNTPATAFEEAPVQSLADETNRHVTAKYLCTVFPQPCLAGNFLERIRTQKVCLDSLQTTDFLVTGFIRVLNIAFDKVVTVRYTFDSWKTSMDAIATYVPNSNDKFSDRFQFSIHAPPYFEVGSTMEFAICYRGGNEEFWDSNYGQNYKLTCCAGAYTNLGFGGNLNSPTTNAFL